MQTLTKNQLAPKSAIKTGSGTTKDDPIDIDAELSTNQAQSSNRPSSYITPDMIDKINQKAL